MERNPCVPRGVGGRGRARVGNVRPSGETDTASNGAVFADSENSAGGADAGGGAFTVTRPAAKLPAITSAKAPDAMRVFQVLAREVASGVDEGCRSRVAAPVPRESASNAKDRSRAE